jgi:hypothetical protein
MMPAMRVLAIAVVVGATVRLAAAQGAGSGSGGEIEMDGDKPAEPTAPVKDPKVVKKWLDAAKLLVQRGDALFKSGKPDEAKDQYGNAQVAYGKALEAGGDASIYLSMEAVDEKLGDAVAAYKHAKQAVDQKAALKPDLVKKAQAKLDELAGKLGMVTLVITPDGAQITIARATVGESPLAEPIVLVPGDYTISLAAVGYQPKDIEIKVEPGTETERKVDLEKVPITVTPVEPEKPPPPAKPPDPLPLYIGAGVTGAFLITTTITGIAAVSNHSTYVSRTATPTQRADARDAGRNFAHVTDAFLVGTIVAAGFTAYWYQYKYRPAHRKMENVGVAPWMSPSTGGVAAVGSF